MGQETANDWFIEKVDEVLVFELHVLGERLKVREDELGVVDV